MQPYIRTLGKDRSLLCHVWVRGRSVSKLKEGTLHIYIMVSVWIIRVEVVTDTWEHKRLCVKVDFPLISNEYIGMVRIIAPFWNWEYLCHTKLSIVGPLLLCAI